MRWLLLTLVLLACLVVVFIGVSSERQSARLSGSATLRAVVAYNPALEKEHGYVLDAYLSVLEEEGIPHEAVDLFTLGDVDPGILAATAPALILPDGLCRRLHSSFAPWLDAYLAAGGALAVIHDAGIQSQTGGLLPRSFLSRHTGVEHVFVAPGDAATHAEGGLRFADAAAAVYCGIPPGKLDAELHLTGYGYGRLVYPVALSRLIPDGPDPQPAVLAWTADASGGDHPAITLRGSGRGAVMYVNLPLGHLKAYGDDLPLRALLRAFTTRVAGLPHLVPSPEGVGAVVINWHLDFADDRAALDDMAAHGLLRADLPCSYHVCAGPDVNRPGDGQGFEACGKGSSYIERLQRIGEIGSHGGWIHNRFAAAVGSGAWGADSIAVHVARNNDCLRQVTGRPVREYSAPAGVHPPRIMTGLLADMGFSCYYYTGDSGSAPNRSFHGGARLSDDLIAFPVMPRGGQASLAEMDAASALPADEVRAWLSATSEYCRRERTVRMVYSHPYNLTRYTHDLDYRPALTGWYEELASLQEAGELRVRTMADCADFLRRAWDTEFTVTLADTGTILSLKNARGLAGVAVALPLSRWDVETPPGCRRLADEMETVLVVTEDLYEIEIAATRR
ncbi:hypothetical protein H8E07_04635 [bacterium]|nr:hypothetical protein [bacterium]